MHSLFCFPLLLALISLPLALAQCPNKCGTPRVAFKQCRKERDQCEVKKCAKGKFSCRTRVIPFATACASAYGDPHISTFDGQTFDCQVQGEFTMVKNIKKKNKFQMQARYSKLEGSKPTYVTAFVMSHRKSPKVQITIPERPLPKSVTPTVVNSCPVVMHVKGRYRELAMGKNVLKNVDVEVTDKTIWLRYKSGIVVRANINPGSGCFISRLTPCIPPSILDVGIISGLLGTPNRNPLDDWADSDGNTIPFPANPRAEENEYCATEWCVKTEGDSLFTYFEDGNSYAADTECAAPAPPTDIDVGMAPDEIGALCGIDENCLLDGIVGGEKGAQTALEESAAIDEEHNADSILKCDPINIMAGTVANVVVTLDVSTATAGNLVGLGKYVLTEIDPNAGLPDADGIMIDLLDNGDSDNADGDAGDNIFTGQFAYASVMAGETLNFRATPVINGAEDPTSFLTTIALSCVRSFSSESGLGQVQGPRNSVVVKSLEGLELKATYSWTDTADLDTNTEFLGDIAGFACFGLPQKDAFVRFLGDMGTTERKEVSRVRLDDTRKRGFWTDKSTVIFRAGWNKVAPNVGLINPVTLTVVLVDEDNKQVPNTSMSVAIAPGVQRECAEREVARMEIEVSGGNTILTLNRAN